MERKVLTCIGCPLGCTITVEMENGAVLRVSGNTCRRGDVYARKEVTAPTRIVTGTVRVVGGTAPVVSVKTAEDIPKDRILACAEMLHGVTVHAPVSIGDVIVPDAAGTGTPLVATKAVAAADR